MKCAEQANPERQKVDYFGLGPYGQGVQLRSTRFISEVMKIFFKLTVMRVAHTCEDAKEY